MSPNSTEPITHPRPRRRRRRILISLAILAALAGMVAVGVRLYLRSESFNRYISAQIQEKLTEYGIRSEIGGFAFAWSSQTARLKDLKLYNGRTGQPLVTLREAEIQCEIRDLWAARLSREIAVKTVRLAGVDLHVEIDGKGATNFEGLRMAPSKSKIPVGPASKFLLSPGKYAIWS